MTTIPPLSQIYAGCIADLESAFGVVINIFGKSVLRALAGVWAGWLWLYYKGLAFLQKNIWVDTADPVSQGGTLERFGKVKLGRLPFPATQGQYSVTVAGTTGATIPAQTVFKSDDTSKSPGYLYILDNAFTLPGSTGTITLRAIIAGTSNLLAITDTLTATAPIINVNSVVTVAAITTFPLAAETTEQYRAKALQAYQLSPQGGAPADYRLWGSDAAGVKQIYPYAWSGHANMGIVYVEAILADSAGPPFKGVPTTTILNDVIADLETDPDTGIQRRPMTVLHIEVLPVDPKTVTIVINSGGTITTAQQAIIKQALIEGLYLIRPFVAGVDNANLRNDTLNTFSVGNIILKSIGSVIISAITITVAGSSTTSYQFDNGEIPYIAAAGITFI